MKIRLVIGSVLLLLPSLSMSEEVYRTATLNGEHELHLSTASGQDVIAPLESEQVGFASPKVSPDGTVAGWLALHPSCCTSYPIPLSLVLFSNGQIIHSFTGAGMPIWEWHFDRNGSRVAYSQSPTHGDNVPHFELRSVHTGKLLASYGGEPSPRAPGWVIRLFGKGSDHEARASKKQASAGNP